MTSEEMEYYNNLCRIMYKTRGCRFLTAEALVNKERFGIIFVALFSVYLLGWSIASTIYPGIFINPRFKALNLISIMASISLLVLSIMDYALGRSVRAEKLQQNALRISSLMRELEREMKSPSPEIETTRRIAIEYEKSMMETQTNHSEMDYTLWLYKTSNSDSFIINFLKKMRFRLYLFYYYFLSLIAHILLSLLMLGVTVWLVCFS